MALLVIAYTIIGIAAIDPPGGHKNLKVLPKNISPDMLDAVMNGFGKALGVKCYFCHVVSKDSAENHLNFASDVNPEKNITRKMMKMTAKLNKKYFSFDKSENAEISQEVSCAMCHRGKPNPNKR